MIWYGCFNKVGKNYNFTIFCKSKSYNMLLLPLSVTWKLKYSFAMFLRESLLIIKLHSQSSWLLSFIQWILKRTLVTQPRATSKPSMMILEPYKTSTQSFVPIKRRWCPLVLWFSQLHVFWSKGKDYSL